MQRAWVGTFGENLPAIPSFQPVKRRRRGPLDGKGRCGSIKETTGESLGPFLRLPLMRRGDHEQDEEAERGKAPLFSQWSLNAVQRFIIVVAGGKDAIDRK